MSLKLYFQIFFASLITPICAQENFDQHWEYIPGIEWSSVDIIKVVGNDFYIGGYFETVFGDSRKGYIVKWDGTNWEALGDGLNLWCSTILPVGNDIYVGGTFSKASDVPSTSYIARWDGTNWNSVGDGLNLHVAALAADSMNNIYAGGAFRNAGGNPDADKIAKWNGANWEAMDKGFNDWVYTIAIHNGEIYAGGAFTSANFNTDVKYIAKWNSVDSLWEPFGNGLNNWVHHIGFNGDDMYIGGLFKDAGGDPNADCIAKWNGTSWEGLGAGLNESSPGSGYYSEVEDFIFYNNEIYVAGQFDKVGEDSTFNNIAKWNGTSWEKFGYGLDQETRTLAIFNNDLYAGGSFSSEGENGLGNVYYFAKWSNLTTAVIDEPQTVNHFSLSQNYPNPFNPNTKIRWHSPESGLQKLKIYNVLGKEILTLVNEYRSKGDYEIDFSAKDLPSGIYFYKLTSGKYSQTKKMSLIK